MTRLSIIRRDKKNSVHASLRELESLLERMKRDTKDETIARYREAIAMGVSIENYERQHQTDYVYPSCELRKTESGELHVAAVNDIALIEVTGILSASDREAAKKAAGTLPMTVAALTNAEATGVVILVKVACSDGTAPTADDSFWQRAGQVAKAVYGSLLPHPVTNISTSIRSAFRMTLDPQPFVNMEATPLRIDDLPIQENKVKRAVISAKKQADYDLYGLYETKYRSASITAIEKTAGLAEGERRNAYFTLLAKELYRLGVPEEEAMLHIANHHQWGSDWNGQLVRTILETVYREGEKAKHTREDNVAGQTYRLIDYLTTRYAFRFNTVMGYTEYRPNNTEYHPWLPVTDRVLKGMTTEARLAGHDAWDKDVVRYVQSNLIERYDPIEAFLWPLYERWDGQDHIGRLAQTVPCDVPQWPHWFRKWFLYMVAQWLGRSHRYGNSVMPLLISCQGFNKSTFCRRLLPDELQWGYNDNLTIEDKKQTLQAMHNFLLINLDEFNQISPKIQEGFLKNVVQLARVKIKRPYGKHVEDFPRLASFIATSNMADVLSDPSGNRRFIAIELTGPIDVSYQINYEQLYAQAIHAIVKQEEQYWFDDLEVRQIMTHNRQFETKTPAEQYFQELFEPAANATEGQWMTTAAIFNELRREAGASLKVDSMKIFGRFLSNMADLQRRRISTGLQYLVKRK